MAKRIFGIALAFIMLYTSIYVPAMAEEAVTETSIYELTARENLLINLGLIDKDGYRGDESMTRGEFAVLLSKALKLEVKAESSTESELPDVDDSTIIQPATKVFRDVDNASDEYGAIMAVYENGCMKGVSDDLFAPEYNMVLGDAIKIFVDILGFHDYAKAEGGYPNGYAKAASKFNLYKGVKCGFYDVAEKSDIASLLVNVMEAPVSEVLFFEKGGISYTASQEKTFMSEIMGIGKLNGYVTDNGITGIKGASKVSVGQLICDDVVLSVSPEKAYARKLLGRKVTAYYDIREADDYKLIYAEANDDAVIIPEKDFVSYNNGVIKYLTKNGSSRTANIGKYKGIIYNGVYTTSYTKDIFDVTDGQITLIRNNSEYTVIIEDYYSMVVAKTETEKYTIHNKLYFNSTSDGINYVNLDDYLEVCILDEAGKVTDFSQIAKNDVLSVMLSPNYRYAEVLVSKKKEENVIFTGIDVEEYESDNGIYVVSDSMKTASNITPVVTGKEYTLYFSVFGTMVWLADEKADMEQSEGIILKYMPPQYDLDYRFGIKIYTENGLIKTYYAEKRFKLNAYAVKAEKAYAVDEQGVESGLLYDLDVIGKPVLYRANGDIIEEIITPCGYMEEDDHRGWYQITADYLPDENADKGLKHIDAGNGASFGGLLNYDKANCNIYSIPHQSLGDLWSNRESIRINETEFVNHSEYRVDGYARIKDAPCADVIVYRDKGTDGTPDPRRAMLISDVHFVLNEELEMLTTFTGYEFTQPGYMSKATYVVWEDAKIVNQSNVATTKSYKNLEEGDIIRFSVNPQNEINCISVSYDYSDGVAENMTCREQAYTYKGYVMSIAENGFRMVTPGNITVGANTESVFYTPSQMESYLKRATTPNEVRDGAKMIRSYLSDNNYPVVIVDTSASKLTFTEASINDVYSYKETRGKYDTMVVCTHYSGGKMGGVVYR